MNSAATPRAAWVRPLMMAAPLVMLFLVLLVYPVGQLLLLSIYSDGSFKWNNYSQLFSSSVYLDTMWITLKISLVTALLSIVGGYPIAYLVSSLQKDKKSRWVFWILLSFWTSFLVRAFAWIVVLGRNGLANQLLLALGLQDAPSNMLYSFGAVLVGMVHALMPLAVLTMLSVMENIDRNLPRAALTTYTGLAKPPAAPAPAAAAPIQAAQPARAPEGAPPAATGSPSFGVSRARVRPSN